jgi:non-ribosomal peptide synthetase component F
MFSCFFLGASLFIIPNSKKIDPNVLHEFISTNKINIVSLPSAMLKSLPREPIESLKTLIYGLELCDLETLKYWRKNVKNLINGLIFFLNFF